MIVARHSFTTSPVLPSTRRPDTVSYDATGKSNPAGRAQPAQSTIYGFNGTFPGPRINAEYGKPAIVRFENHLDENRQPRPAGLRCAGLLVPDPPAQRAHRVGVRRQPRTTPAVRPQHHGYLPGPVVRQHVSELAGRAATTGRSRGSSGSTITAWTTPGANVYKGMVGLYPIYDPKTDGQRRRDEQKGLRLPACAPTTATAPSTSTTTSRSRSSTAGSTTASPAQGHPQRQGRVPGGGQPADASGVVGQDVLQALPESRLRR